MKYEHELEMKKIAQQKQDAIDLANHELENQKALIASNSSGSSPYVDSQGKFIGTSYDAAIAYVKSQGLPTEIVSSALTRSEWNRRKSNSSKENPGAWEVTKYNSYEEYIQDYVELKINDFNF